MSEEFPELPEGWVRASLSDLGDWVGGGTPSKSNSNYWESGTVPWLSPKDMKRLRIDSTEDHITEQAVTETVVRKVPAGSIAFVVRSGILSRTLPIAVLDVEVTVNQDMRVLVPDGEINSDWLLLVLLADSEAIRFQCQKDGTTVASLDVPALAQWTVAVPPPLEQDRIVERTEALLSITTQGSNGVDDVRPLLRELRAGLLEELSLSAATVALSTRAKIHSGITKNKAKEAGLREVPYLRTANVQAGALDLELIRTIGATPQQIDRHRLATGDVLVVEGGDADKVGRGWIWEGQIDECIHQNHVFAVRADPELLEPRFLAHFINAPTTRRFFLSSAKQTTNLASINKTQLGSLPIPDLSIDQQRRRVEIIESHFAELRALEATVESLTPEAANLRRGILIAARDGTLTTQVPSDAPAGELLSLIRSKRSERAASQFPTRKRHPARAGVTP